MDGWVHVHGCMDGWMDGSLAGGRQGGREGGREGGMHACMHACMHTRTEARKEGSMDGWNMCICRHILYACVNPALGARQGKAFPVTRLLGERIPKRSLSLLASFARFEGCGVRLRVSI